MRIAHVETSRNIGGQELRTLNQVECLNNQGHSAWLLVRKDSALYKEAQGRGLPVHPVPFRGSIHPRAVSEVIKFCQDEGIHLLDCHSESAASTAAAARVFGIPVVRTLHVHTFKMDLVHKYLWRYGSDHVITVSRAIADHLIELGFADPQRVSVIPTGIDLNRFRPDIEGHSVRREFNIADTARVISIIAMIRPDKGQTCFLRAVDAVADARPDVRFLIVGCATKQEFFAEIEKEIAALRHKDQVILTGFRHDVEKVIAASDVIVNSSPHEARSQVIHQAFAMKALVVAGNRGGNLESITDGETGLLFPAGNVEALAGTILKALDNHTEQIRERAYRTALLHYGLDTMMRKTLKAYRMVLKADKQVSEANFSGPSTADLFRLTVNHLSHLWETCEKADRRPTIRHLRNRRNRP